MIKLRLSSYELGKIAKKYPDKYEELRGLEPDLPTLQDMLDGKGYGEFERYVNDPQALPDWIADFAELKIPKPLRILAPEGMAIKGQNFKELMAFPQIHIHSQGLMQLNKVKVIENACTNELQDRIDEGWRIIAVCQQIGDRRPDYVLGKVELPT